MYGLSPDNLPIFLNPSTSDILTWMIEIGLSNSISCSTRSWLNTSRHKKLISHIPSSLISFILLEVSYFSSDNLGVSDKNMAMLWYHQARRFCVSVEKNHLLVRSWMDVIVQISVIRSHQNWTYASYCKNRSVRFLTSFVPWNSLTELSDELFFSRHYRPIHLISMLVIESIFLRWNQ